MLQVLTAPELARQMGMSHSEILQWIKKGKVNPLSGPGIDRCGHYLFAVSEEE